MPLPPVKQPNKAFGTIIKLAQCTIPFRGKLRLMNWLCRPFFHEGAWLIPSSRFGRRIHFPSIKDPLALNVMSNGVYEPSTISAILQDLPPHPVILDIGANIGLITLGLANQLRGRGKILAIEGSERIYDFLQANAADLPGVTLVQALLFSENKMVRFHEAPASRSGMGSLFTPFAENIVTREARTLSEILQKHQIDRIDAVKIDVEGGELEVLEGAAWLFARPQAPKVVFEHQQWSQDLKKRSDGATIQCFLEKSGYRIWSLDDYQARKAPMAPAARMKDGMFVATKTPLRSVGT